MASLLFHAVLLGRKSLHWRGVTAHLPEGRVSTGIIYVLNHFFMSTRTSRYLLYLLGYDSMLLYFLAPTLSVLATVSPLSGLRHPSAYPHTVGFSSPFFISFFRVFSYFLAWQDVPGSSYTFSPLILESAISPRAWFPLETEIQVLSMFTATRAFHGISIYYWKLC